MTERFQVDLAGMVDLLSHHLYSGPQVYLRELLQNAVDAITARSAQQPGAPGSIRLRASDDAEGRATLELIDTGVGLTADEATELLATIGRSSKRDDVMGAGRAEFIGQFGIGLLAAFMVAEQIEVRSRSIRPGAEAIRWIGRADGTFEVGPDSDPARPIGTSVRLIARPDAAHWLSPDTVLALATDYGSLLPFDVAVEVGEAEGAHGAAEAAPSEGGTSASDTGTGLWRRISRSDLPWQAPYDSEADRRRALTAYCEEIFGFTPLGHVDLRLPAAGVSGVAFLLPQAVSPGSGQHRVYLKRMLLGQRVDRVMPEWAFFARAVIDADALSPTASREQLHDDEVLLGVREALGDQLKHWALQTLRTPSALSRSFIETHHLALRALALTDAEMLALVAEVLPYETTDGPLTLAEAARGGSDEPDAAGSAQEREIVYTTTTEAYRRVAAVARAQGLVVVNAGYVYDADLLARLGQRPGWRVRELSSDDLVQVLRVPGLEREMQLASAIAAARDALQEDDCDVIVRGFSPESVSAMLLRDADGERRRELDRERSAAPDRWGGLLDAFAEESAPRSRTLVLNDDSPLTRRLLQAPDSPVFASGLRAVYLSAVMLAGEGLRSREAAALGDALGTLLDASLHTPKPPQEKEIT